ncbi:uncharacterized protein LOC127842515 isoform X2 [Dreissena polymorpha]|uniref:Uncharacterized protein n=1 Tax=Dreissena polymorpha TaxID=45954 RepID=A0A9D4EVD6_DREPO|nr:uncharacterized protein LOC127842515 isoform X2 [Dreissena polymorpha]KAH3787345.1 hypothetical protein DPMN_165469 [Dreissena polymorpha]
MLGKILLFVVIALLDPCSGWSFWGRNQSDWNGLKVTWGLNPWTSYNDMPRTRDAALVDGWRKLDAGSRCQGDHVVGERFVKNGDLGVVLLYDKNGFIAGIQAGFDKAYMPNPNGYPFQPLVNAPFVEYPRPGGGSDLFVTAYFVPPEKICSTGRNADEFLRQGTGVGLWIQNGKNPLTDSVRMPPTIEAARKSQWTEGACFYTMGVHFWHNTSKTMSCDELFPVFLMYNDGVLNAFGWAFGMDIRSSAWLEHPPKNSYGHFMKVIPDCLYRLGTLTTLHIYLTDSALADRC